MAQPSFAKHSSDALFKWKTMRFTRKAEIERAAQRIISYKARYLRVANAANVPWIMIGVLHMRESGNDFLGVLHNGQHIIGTGRRTTIEPKGRGPFASWEEAAVDALRIKGWVGRPATYWSLDRILYEMERFNGWGYAWKGRPSPYMWAGTQHYTRGKYISDGVYSSTFVDPQLGCAPVYKRVMELEGIMSPGPLAYPGASWVLRLKQLLSASGLATLLSWNTVDAVQQFLSQNQLLILLCVGVALWLFLNTIEGGPKKDDDDGLAMAGAEPELVDELPFALEDNPRPAPTRRRASTRRKNTRGSVRKATRSTRAPSRRSMG